MKRLFAIIILGAWTLCHSDPNDAGQLVTFIGNNQYQPQQVDWLRSQGVKVTVINLDDHQNLEKQLAEGLPHDNADRAIAMARQRVASVPQARWKNLFVGPMDAKKWGITRYPAIVFGDGESVIYGVVDLKAAFTKWQEFEQQKNGARND